MSKKNSFLITTNAGANTWIKASLMEATHRLIENDDYETEEGLPIWDSFDLDGNLEGHRIIPAEFLEMDGEDDGNSN